MNKLNERRKATPISAFAFSTLSKTKLIFRCIGRMTKKHMWAGTIKIKNIANFQ